MMYGAAASIRTTQSILQGGLREVNLHFWPTVVVALALALTLQAQYECLHIFLGYIL